MTYAFDCSNAPNATNFQIYPTSANPSVLVDVVNELTKEGSGSKDYTTAGTFYLVINTQCSWAIRVSAK